MFCFTLRTMSKQPFQFLLQFTAVAALTIPSLVGLVACGSGGSAATDETQTTGDQLASCNAGTEIAWQNGKKLGPMNLMEIDGKNVAIKTGHAYLKLEAQMAAKGVSLSVNSGFRTMAEQQHLYGCYVHKNCNDGHLAARPGFSNHQHGRAVDIQISDNRKFVAAIKSLGLSGVWKNTVRGESWHWEYFGTDPGGICDADSIGPVSDTAPEDPGPALAENDETATYSDDGSDAPGLLR